MNLVFVEVLAKCNVRYVGCILASLVMVGVCLCKLAHLLLEGFGLCKYIVCTIVLVDVGGYGFPLVLHIIVAEPHLVYADGIARMVHGELQELLLHHIAIALHNGTICHVCNGRYWVVSYALTSFCLFQWTAETTLLMCQIAIHLVTGGSVEASQRYVVFVHAVDFIEACLTQQACLVGLLQCSFGAGVYSSPELVYIVVAFKGEDKLLG